MGRGQTNFKKKAPTRETAMEAASVYNALVGEMISAANLIRYHGACYRAGKITPMEYGAIEQMCLSFLMLGCAKFAEAYRHFNVLFRGTGLHKACTHHCDEIARLAIKSFRDDVVGHVVNARTGDAVLPLDVLARLDVIRDGRTPDELLDWLSPLRASDPLDSIVGCADSVQSFVMQQYSIAPSDLGLVE